MEKQLEKDWINKGNGLYKEERYEDAIYCYDQVIEFDPKNAVVWNNKGLSFDKLGRRDESIQCYKKALKINPQNVHAWCNFGISFDALHQYEKAFYCFDKALEFDSKHILSWQKKGDSLRSVGRDKEAIHCYEMVVKLDARNAFAWYGKALCQEKLGFRKNAYSSYSELTLLAIGLNGGEAALEACRVERVILPRELLDHASKRMRELKKTFDNQEMIENTVPLQVSPPNVLLSPSKNIPDFDMGKPIQYLGSEFHAQDFNYWYSIGQQLCDLGNYEEALFFFENALQFKPQYALAWREKSFCEENLGRTVDAIRSCEQVMAFAEDNPELFQNAFGRLAELERSQKPSIEHKEDIASQNSKSKSVSLSIIKRIPVVSTNLRSVGYNNVNEILEIEFTNGSVYQYFGVLQNIYVELMQAESHGKYFYAFVRDRFEYQQVCHKSIQPYYPAIANVEEYGDDDEVDLYSEAYGRCMDGQWIPWDDD